MTFANYPQYIGNRTIVVQALGDDGNPTRDRVGYKNFYPNQAMMFFILSKAPIIFSKSSMKIDLKLENYRDLLKLDNRKVFI
jgi:hypothetical protein